MLWLELKLAAKLLLQLTKLSTVLISIHASALRVARMATLAVSTLTGI
jgi:hypothetical protein